MYLKTGILCIKDEKFMNAYTRTMKVILALLLAIFFTSCDKDSGIVGDNGVDNEVGNEVEISMITPYVNESDMASINEAFSSDDSAPWGFEHRGIDFFPNGNLKPFRAVSSGVIDELKLWQNNVTSNWQVNVRIKYNSTYSIEYAFEPMSAVGADGETQLTNMLVSMRQVVSQGDVIGHLYTVGGGAHVDFSLFKNSVPICPESYFTQEARDSILKLIHIVWSDANMCY